MLDFTRYLKNSALIAAGATVDGPFAGTLRAYGLSRYRLPWRLNYWLLFVLLAARSFPPTETRIPLFVFFGTWGCLDTVLAVILAQVYLALPFIVLLTRGFFADIPLDLEGKARLVQQFSIARGPMTASDVLFTVILQIFAVLVQRNLMRGLTAGAIKA